MKKILFTIVIFVCLIFSSFAGHVPEKTAKIVALNTLYQFTQVKQSDILLDEPIIISNQNTVLYYIFNMNNPEGFVIIAADDRVVPVLAFSDEGNYILNQEQANFKAWMNSYEEQIIYVIEHDLQSSPEIAALWQQYSNAHEQFTFDKNTKDISPLLGSIEWNQNTGWNNECPVDLSGPGGHCYAGCVATASGQVMMYWQHPNQGTGSHSYDHPTYGTQSADFGSTTYDWSGMSPTAAVGDCPILLYHLVLPMKWIMGPVVPERRLLGLNMFCQHILDTKIHLIGFTSLISMKQSGKTY